MQICLYLVVVPFICWISHLSIFDLKNTIFPKRMLRFNKIWPVIWRWRAHILGSDKCSEHIYLISCETCKFRIELYMMLLHLFKWCVKTFILYLKCQMHKKNFKNVTPFIEKTQRIVPMTLAWLWTRNLRN